MSYIICKYVLSVAFLLSSWNHLQHKKLQQIIFAVENYSDVVQIIFSFVACAFGVESKKPLPNSKSEDLLLGSFLSVSSF